MVFWFSRLGMTAWLIAPWVLGATGASFLHWLWLVPAGAFLYQGFNGLERPWLSEATLRILLYSFVGLLIVFSVFFVAGRLAYWIF